MLCGCHRVSNIICVCGRFVINTVLHARAGLGAAPLLNLDVFCDLLFSCFATASKQTSSYVCSFAHRTALNMWQARIRMWQKTEGRIG